MSTGLEGSKVTGPCSDSTAQHGTVRHSRTVRVVPGQCVGAHRGGMGKGPQRMRMSSKANDKCPCKRQKSDTEKSNDTKMAAMCSHQERVPVYPTLL